jgi:hypothetical protein
MCRSSLCLFIPGSHSKNQLFITYYANGCLNYNSSLSGCDMLPLSSRLLNMCYLPKRVSYHIPEGRSIDSHHNDHLTTSII